MKLVRLVFSRDYQTSLTSIYDVNAIANVEKTVPQEWIINDGTGVSQEALDYMRPLIQGEIYPYMVDGLPRHIKL